MNLNEVIGSVEQVLTDNYPDNQLFSAVDWLLNSSVDIVLKHTTLYEQLIIELQQLPHQMKQFTDRDRFDLLSPQFLAARSHKERFDLFKRLRLYRDRITNVIQTFLSISEEYLYLRAKKRSIAHLLPIISARNDNDLARALVVAEGYYEHYKELKEAILAKYNKMVIKASNNRHKVTIDMSIDDVTMINIQYARKAFDRFDWMEGTFAPHISNWVNLYSNKAITRADPGYAFNTPQHERQKMALGESDLNNFLLNNLSLEDHQHHISNLASDAFSVSDMQILSDKENFFNNILNDLDPRYLYRVFNTHPSIRWDERWQLKF